jgi:hypothetical protein
LGAGSRSREEGPGFVGGVGWFTVILPSRNLDSHEKFAVRAATKGFRSSEMFEHKPLGCLNFPLHEPDTRIR